MKLPIVCVMLAITFGLCLTACVRLATQSDDVVLGVIYIVFTGIPFGISIAALVEVVFEMRRAEKIL